MLSKQTMGLRGPKQKPIAIIKKRDYYRPSVHRDDIVESKAALEFVHNGFPTPPEHFDDDAKDIWTTTLAQASKLYGYISFIDLKIFEEYCECYSELKELTKQCKTKKRVYYKDNRGNMKPHPIFKARDDKRQLFMKLSGEFGFTPSSRTRVVLQKPKDLPKQVDEFEI